MPNKKNSSWMSALSLLLSISFAGFVQSVSAAEVPGAQVQQLPGAKIRPSAGSTFESGSYSATYKEQPATIPKSAQPLNIDFKAANAVDYISEIKPDGLYCWPASKLPVKVYFQPAKKVLGYKSRFVPCLASCFDEWAAASSGKLSWVRVDDPSQANIVVRWTNAVTERAEGTEAGRTKTFASLNTATNCGTIRGAEIRLLTRLPEREFSSDELRRAYLHEVGHAFGIAGHSHNPEDVMYYAVTQHASPHLDERDKSTINRLYSSQGSNSFELSADF